MRVLGIDPGTAITGFGVVEERFGEAALVAYGALRTSARDPMAKRLATLQHDLQQLIKMHTPDEAAVEKLFFQKNVRTAISVGQARGVILMTLGAEDTPVYEYTPLEIKQAVAGYGAAGKRQVQQMVQTLLRMQEIPAPDDAADALAVAICHLHSSVLRRLAEAA